MLLPAATPRSAEASIYQVPTLPPLALHSADAANQQLGVAGQAVAGQAVAGQAATAGLCSAREPRLPGGERPSRQISRPQSARNSRARSRQQTPPVAHRPPAGVDRNAVEAGSCLSTHEIPASSPVEHEERDTDGRLLVDARCLLISKDIPSDGTSASALAHDLSREPGWAGRVSEVLLQGWEPQPSPCCAAASVAGAFNALWELGPHEPQRANVLEVAALMAANCQRLCRRQQQALERLTGAAYGMLDSVFNAADELLEARCFDWSATKGSPGEITIDAYMVALRDVVEAIPEYKRFRGHAAVATLRCALVKVLGRGRRPVRASSRRASVGLEYFADDPARVDEVILSPRSLRAAVGAACRQRSGRSLNSGRGAASPDFAASSGGGRCSSERSRSKAICRNRSSCGRSGAVIRKLAKIIVKRRGARRLLAERPKTSDVGSWGVVQAAHDLTRKKSCGGLKISLLLGCKRSGRRAAKCVVRPGDGARAVEEQWVALKSAFGSPSSVLLFHLRNHYALIYGWREWQPYGAHKRRQILTARKGQRPSAWLDFEEVREIMISWVGYHILQFELSTTVSVVQEMLAEELESDDGTSCSETTDMNVN